MRTTLKRGTDYSRGPQVEHKFVVFDFNKLHLNAHATSALQKMAPNSDTPLAQNDLDDPKQSRRKHTVLLRFRVLPVASPLRAIRSEAGVYSPPGPGAES